MSYTTEKLAPNVLVVKIPNFKAGSEQSFLLHMDEHMDNAHADLAMMQRLDSEATRKGAGIFCIGDFFCAMQGKWDKRSDKSQLRPEVRDGNYLDEIVKFNAAAIEPNASSYIMMSPGNHEESVTKRHETNLTERLIERVASNTGHKIHMGTYCGWVLFRFMSGPLDSSSMTCTVPMFYHHGFGGGGPVTKGVIQATRMTNFADADIIVSGHTHDEWIITNMRAGVSKAGKPYQYRQWCLRAPGFKDEWSCGHGFHVGTGKPPKPKGGMWIDFKYEDTGQRTDERRTFVTTNARLAI